MCVLCERLREGKARDAVLSFLHSFSICYSKKESLRGSGIKVGVDEYQNIPDAEQSSLGSVPPPLVY